MNMLIVSWQQIFCKGGEHSENASILVDSLPTEPRLKLQGVEGGKQFSVRLQFIFLQTTGMKNCVFSHGPKSSFLHCASLT